MLLFYFFSFDRGLRSTLGCIYRRRRQMKLDAGVCAGWMAAVNSSSSSSSRISGWRRHRNQPTVSTTPYVDRAFHYQPLLSPGLDRATTVGLQSPRRPTDRRRRTTAGRHDISPPPPSPPPRDAAAGGCGCWTRQSDVVPATAAN